MAKTRWTGTVAGLPVNLLREDLSDAPPSGGGTTPPPAPDPDDDPPPQGDPGDENPPAQDPPPAGGGDNPPPAAVYRYREPQRLKFFNELERDENGYLTIGYTGDRAGDGQPDTVKVRAAFESGKQITGSIGRLREMVEGAKRGDVIKLTGGGGYIPGGEWRVPTPDLVIEGEPNATYEFQAGNLPGGKGLPLGFSELDGGFWWRGMGCHVAKAILPVDGQDHNGAGIRQTRCPYTLVSDTTYWDCQDGFLGDGTYKGVICQRVELDRVRYKRSGTKHGKEHHVYIQKTCRQFLARDCDFGAVIEGHDIQYRGWEMYVLRCTHDDEGSTKSYLYSLPNGTVALIEDCEAHFRPGRSQDMAIGIGQVADAVDRQPEVGLTLRNCKLIDHGSKVKGVVRRAGWIPEPWVKLENSPLVQAA